MEDFEQFPVWEHALDEETEEGQDEATVRPHEYIPPLDPAEGMFAVRTQFTLADGTEVMGYVTPQPPGLDELFPDTHPLAGLQPVIVLDKGQVMFWHGIMAPDSENISSMYEMLGKTEGEIFPLSYQTDVELKHGQVQGTITGFLYIAEEKKGFFSRRRRVVKEIR
jgi:hypothetical protein